MNSLFIFPVQRIFICENVKDSELEKCALLGYYAVSSGNFLPTFRDDLSILPSGFKNPKKKPCSPNMEFI